MRLFTFLIYMLTPIIIFGQNETSQSKKDNLIKANPFSFERAVVHKDGISQLIDSLGNIYTSARYSEITQIYRDSFYRVKYSNFYGLIDKNGESVISTKYDWLDGQNHLTGIIAKKNGKYGVINKEGEIVLPFKSETKPDKFENGILYLKESNPIQINGDPLFSPELYYLKSIFNEYFLTGKDEKMGITNIVDNTTLVPHQYDFIRNFSSCGKLDYFIVNNGDSYGLIDINNNIILPLKYAYIKGNPNRDIVLAKITLNSDYEIFDFQGKKLSNDTFENVTNNFEFPPFAVKQNGKWGYINNKGKVVIPFEYDNAGSFGQRYRKGRFKKFDFYNPLSLYDCFYYSEIKDTTVFAEVKKDGLQYMINQKGEVENIALQKENSIGDGWIKFTPNDKFWGVKNPKGEIILGPEYLEITSYQNGIISFKNKEKQNGLYFLNNKKSVIYDKVQQSVGMFTGIRWVKQDGLYGFINNNGEQITPIHFERVGTGSNGFRAVTKDGKVGFINQKGIIEIPFQFQEDYLFNSAYKFVHGFSVALENNKYGIINKKGETVVPFECDAISFCMYGVAIVYRNNKWEKIILNQ